MRVSVRGAIKVAVAACVLLVASNVGAQDRFQETQKPPPAPPEFGMVGRLPPYPGDPHAPEYGVGIVANDWGREGVRGFDDTFAGFDPPPLFRFAPGGLALSGIGDSVQARNTGYPLAWFASVQDNRNAGRWLALGMRVVHWVLRSSVSI